MPTSSWLLVSVTVAPGTGPDGAELASARVRRLSPPQPVNPTATANPIPPHTDRLAIHGYSRPVALELEPIGPPATRSCSGGGYDTSARLSLPLTQHVLLAMQRQIPRSEERRVGKEG